MGRTIFYLILSVFIFSGCKRKSAGKLFSAYVYNARESDRLRNELSKDTALRVSDAGYDSLLFGNWQGNMLQLFYAVQDFHAYMDNVHYQLKLFRNTAKVTGAELTNAFIKNGENTTGVLHGKIPDITNRWRSVTNNPALLKRVEKLESITYKRFKTSDDLLQAYFFDQSPEDVTTILNNFDKTVMAIHYDVVTEYLKHQPGAPTK